MTVTCPLLILIPFSSLRNCSDWAVEIISPAKGRLSGFGCQHHTISSRSNTGHCRSCRERERERERGGGGGGGEKDRGRRKVGRRRKVKRGMGFGMFSCMSDLPGERRSTTTLIGLVGLLGR